MTEVVRIGPAPDEGTPRQYPRPPRLRELAVERLEVVGELPDGLRGRLLHVGPGPDAATGASTTLAMVHAVDLASGRADYTSRWLVGGDATACYSGLLVHAGRLVVLGDHAAPVELDDELIPVDGTRPPWGIGAHVHVDPVWDDLLAVEAPPDEARIFLTVADQRGRVQRVVEIPTDAPVAVHDFAFTDRFVVVIVAGGAGSDVPARIGLIPRLDDAPVARWFEASPRWVRHFMNAFEVDGEVVIDHVAHRRTGGGTSDAVAAVLLRTSVNPVTGEVRDDLLDDHAIEFPAIDPRRSGLRHRIGYAALGASGIDGHHGEFDGIVRYDLRNGTVTDHVFAAPTRVGAPVVARRAGGTGEDDAWVLALTSDAVARTSRLAVFDPRTFARGPIAEVVLPQMLPAGHHAIWVPDAG
jgi:carotenoid cleavage dioxygenase